MSLKAISAAVGEELHQQKATITSHVKKYLNSLPIPALISKLLCIFWPTLQTRPVRTGSVHSATYL